MQIRNKSLSRLVMAGGASAGVLLAALGGAALAEESGMWRSHAVLVKVESRVLPVAGQDGHDLSVDRLEGVAFNSDGKDFLHQARYEVTELSDSAGGLLVDGKIVAGYKTFTMADGSSVLAKFVVDRIEDPDDYGSFEFLSGTGRYQGITGNGTFRGHWVSDTVLWDKLEGEYKIPQAD